MFNDTKLVNDNNNNDPRTPVSHGITPIFSWIPDHKNCKTFGFFPPLHFMYYYFFRLCIFIYFFAFCVAYIFGSLSNILGSPTPSLMLLLLPLLCFPLCFISPMTL